MHRADPPAPRSGLDAVVATLRERRHRHDVLGARAETDEPLPERERELVLNALSAANTRSAGGGARHLGLAAPQSVPLCFTPEAGGATSLACPQATVDLGAGPSAAAVAGKTASAVKGSDILLLEFLGVVGAAISVTALFRGLKRGTSTPYNVPFSLAMLKLPTGALTAVAGLLLMRADFVPGLSALDSSGQILGWALVFGIAQQFVTQVADNRAHALLEDVGGRGAAGDRPIATEA